MGILLQIGQFILFHPNHLNDFQSSFWMVFKKLPLIQNQSSDLYPSVTNLHSKILLYQDLFILILITHLISQHHQSLPLEELLPLNFHQKFMGHVHLLFRERVQELELPLPLRLPSHHSSLITEIHLYLANDHQFLPDH